MARDCSGRGPSRAGALSRGRADDRATLAFPAPLLRRDAGAHDERRVPVEAPPSPCPHDRRARRGTCVHRASRRCGRVGARSDGDRTRGERRRDRSVVVRTAPPGAGGGFVSRPAVVDVVPVARPCPCRRRGAGGTARRGARVRCASATPTTPGLEFHDTSCRRSAGCGERLCCRPPGAGRVPRGPAVAGATCAIVRAGR